MKCDQAHELICAWIAFEVSEAQHQQLNEHLADCMDCRLVSEQWRQDDLRLKRLFGSQKAAITRIETGVLRSLPDVKLSTPRSSWQSLLSVVLAMAVGFLLAAVIFQPWTSDRDLRTVTETDPDRQPPPAPAVARLVVATGPVQYRQQGMADWQSVTELEAFSCSASTELMTGPDSCCEIATLEGGVLRLNSNTNLTVESSRCIRLSNGEVWCRAADSAPFEVIASCTEESSPQADPVEWILNCPSDVTCMTSVSETESRVMADKGTVELVTNSGRHSVEAGQLVSVTADGAVAQSQAQHALLAVGWMDRLLVRKQPTDPDLQQRVDALLAQIGLSKASYLFERELRGLGEHSVLPLTRFVQSPLSQQYPARRFTAMRVLADASPTWNIGNLIALLSDSDPEIRILAATALQRLTGETHGREPQTWQQPLTEPDPVLTAWNDWWTLNSNRYPPINADPRR
jgi:hypothetical protein